MSARNAAWYFNKAKTEMEVEGKIEFDEPSVTNPQLLEEYYAKVVSLGDDAGAYVQGWIWVPDEPAEIEALYMAAEAGR